MKKRLTVAQIFFVLVSAILPLFDRMFEWIVYTRFYNIAKIDKSLQNLMTVQQIGIGSFAYCLFCGVVIAILICFTADLFFDDKVIVKRLGFILSFALPVLGLLMIITADMHTDMFKVENEIRYIAIALKPLAYVEIIALITLPVIECYKKFRCK